MNIILNGETAEIPDGITLSGMVAHFDLAEKRVAIELNKSVIRRNNWPETKVAEGDRVEIVHFVGGG